MTKKFKPRTFTLFKDEWKRAEQINLLFGAVDGLPIDRVFNVKISEGQETRRNVANRLYQSVIGQLSRQVKQRDGESDIEASDPDVIAGKLKYHILLPLKPVMAAEYDDSDLATEAEFERDLCELVLSSSHIEGYDLYRAYDRAIRSKTLKTKPFARYLNDVIDKLTMQGFVIHLEASERDRALNEQYSKTGN